MTYDKAISPHNWFQSYHTAESLNKQQCGITILVRKLSYFYQPEHAVEIYLCQQHRPKKIEISTIHRSDKKTGSSGHSGITLDVNNCVLLANARQQYIWSSVDSLFVFRGCVAIWNIWFAKND